MSDASQLARRIAACLAADHCLEGVSRLLVGFSGGADSTALLLLLGELGIPLVAHHIHHGLRGPDADGDGEWCRQFCASRGISFALHRLSIPDLAQPGESVETAARRCRLELWDQLCQPDDAVALGHHADDALEDLLLRLARGANASGLVGLRPRRRIGQVLLVRPLLGIRRQELVDYLLACGVHDWREDRTNTDPQHRRNAVRHQLLPLFRTVFGDDTGLLRALAALREDADFLEDQARRALLAPLSLADWRQLPPALLPRVLRLWLQAETGTDLPPAHADIARLRHELGRACDHPVEIPLSCGRSLRLDRDGLHLASPPSPLPERHWHWQRNPVLPLPEISAELAVDPVGDLPGESFARAALPPLLTIRSRRPGDRLVPFGGHTPKKLKELFIDAHVPRPRRDAFPILLAEDTILWVPGLRRAEFGRVAPGQPAVRFVLRNWGGD